MPISKIGAKAAAFRSVHRTVAAVLIVFAAAHIANHFAGLVSVPLHVSVMERLRTVYRTPVIETALIACVFVQALTGLVLLGRRWKTRSGTTASLQLISGAYLALFLVIHVAAVLYGRTALGLDTNFYFAAAGLHAPPFGYFFGPYYFFAVLALFVHIGCAVSRSPRRSPRARVFTRTAFSAMGVVASLLIVANLAGLLSDYTIPREYMNTFAARGNQP